MATRFLLVDDHPLVREGIALALARVTAQVELVTAASCEEAADLLVRDPDLDMVLLDMQLPGRSHLAALHHLRGIAPQTLFVALSAETPSSLIHDVLAAGARGFIPKSSTLDIMVLALRLVFAGGVYVPPAALLPELPVTADRLTQRQERVLRELARGASTAAIAATLGIAEATVRVHVAAIVRTLGVETREEAIQTPLALRLRDAPSP